MGWQYDIPIGHDMLVQFSGEPARFKSHYYGAKPEEFLIIQMPGIPGIREKLLSGAGLVVRYVVGGKVYGFKCQALAHVMRPCPLIFVSFPQSVETVNLRNAERISTFLEAKATMGSVVLQGVIVDMSAGGCLFTITRTTGLTWPQVEPGQVLRLGFSLDKDGDITIDAEVVSARKSVDKMNLGLKFILAQGDQAAEAALRDYVGHVLQFAQGKG